MTITAIDDDEQEVHDLRQFPESVRKYTDSEELTAEMLNELVDKIIVHLCFFKCAGHIILLLFPKSLIYYDLLRSAPHRMER